MQHNPKTHAQWLTDNALDLEKPIVHNHKHNCLGCSCEGRGWEAFRIFMETQLKRLFRLITFFQTNKYFAHRETNDDIYKNDEVREEEGDYIQNLGHATQLLRMSGMTILTDPVFGDLNWLLYPAKTRSGLTADQLPEIDAIVISHNHRDHVDEDSLEKLVTKYPDMKVFVPDGDRHLFISMGFKAENVFPAEWHTSIVMSKNDDNGTKIYLPVELMNKFRTTLEDELKTSQSWWSKKFGDQRDFAAEVASRTIHYKNIDEFSEEHRTQVKITALPSKHWSGRNGFDNAESATNGWIFSSNGVTYFAGDTAMPSSDTIKVMSAKIYENLSVDFLNDEAKKVTLLLPDGPNYTRAHMKGTHMSIIDGMMMSLEFARNLSDLSRHMGAPEKVHSVEYWLTRCTTALIHHNKYELGPDIFNQGYYVWKDVIEPTLNEVFAKDSFGEIQEELTQKENIEKAKWSIFLRKKDDWVYKGIKDLINLAKEILTKDDVEPTKEQVKEFIVQHIESIKNPKIGERMDCSKKNTVTSFRSIAEKTGVDVGNAI